MSLHALLTKSGPKHAGRRLVAQAGWDVVGGRRIYFRSKKERQYAHHLEGLRAAGAIVSWEHEPKRFEFPEKRGTNSYLPDFRVTYADGRVEWHEVKGWLDDKSRVQLQRMAKYYPEETLVLVGARMPPKPSRPRPSARAKVPR